MSQRVPGLFLPPYLQIAFDLVNLTEVKKILSSVPKSPRIIVEVGTPLLKKHGVKVVRELREIRKNAFIVADLKTLDVGQLEVNIAFDETADAAVVSGLASKETLDSFIAEARSRDIYSFMDMMCVVDPVQVLKSLKQLPDAVILHRGIDEEKGGKTRWELIREIKETFKGKKLLFAVAGGVEPKITKEALLAGADILVVGRYITQSKDVERAVNDFLVLIDGFVDEFGVCML
jgi:bifunctional enzyme Fae/Hps